MQSANINDNVFRVFANKQGLEALPESEQYLYRNYKWQSFDPSDQNRVCVEFKDDDFADGFLEAAALYHELWHVRFTPGLNLTRNWA